jgi:glyoxylate reductase
MKPSAYLVNTSGGDVVDEPALITALRERRIAGAGLDVMQTEPLDPAHALCSLPNVILQPHAGSATVETRTAMLDLAVRNLVAGLQGRGMPQG